MREHVSATMKNVVLWYANIAGFARAYVGFNQLDLEDRRPKLSCDVHFAQLSIKGYSVEHIGRLDVRLTCGGSCGLPVQNAVTHYPSHDLGSAWVNSRDAINAKDVCPPC